MSDAGNAKLRLATAVAIGVLVLDQVTKAIVESTMTPYQTIELLPFLALTSVRNTGAAFGVFAAAPASLRLPLFLGVTVIAIVALVSFLRRTSPAQPWLVGALGGILGGAVGNLICRVRYGEVIDFIDAHWADLHWPTFNVADSAITVGVAIILLSGFQERPETHVSGRNGPRV
jgi:signal peptidase II